MKFRHQFTGALIASIPLLLLSVPAVAQDDDEEESQSPTLERIVVTAQKRETTLQDVPFSITAQTGESLQRAGATNIEEIAGNISGFTVQNLGPGQSQVARRGVSAGQIVRDQPGVKEQVGIYLDESVISLSLFTPDLDLFDLDRVEVLKGPQGTLFGSGSLSGTVRYITQQPKLGVREAEVFLEGNVVEEDDFGGNVKGVLNLPMGLSGAMRAAVYYNRLGGFIDAIQPDGSIKDNVNSGERYGGRLAFRFEPTASFVISPRLIYQKIEIDGFNREDNYNILANPFTTTRPRVNIGKREQFTQLKEEFSDEFFLADLTAEYTFPNSMSLTSVTSYTDRDVLQIRDATALTGSITGGTIGLGEEIFTLDAPLFDATEVEMNSAWPPIPPTVSAGSSARSTATSNAITGRIYPSPVSRICPESPPKARLRPGTCCFSRAFLTISNSSRCSARAHWPSPILSI